jgi:hypothetical protein
MDMCSGHLTIVDASLIRSSSSSARLRGGDPVDSRRGRRRTSVDRATRAQSSACASTPMRIRGDIRRFRLRCSTIVAVDVDALESTERVTVTVVTARADHGDVVSGPPKRETLLPDSPVRRERRDSPRA